MLVAWSLHSLPALHIVATFLLRSRCICELLGASKVPIHSFLLKCRLSKPTSPPCLVPPASCVLPPSFLPCWQPTGKAFDRAPESVGCKATVVSLYGKELLCLVRTQAWDDRRSCSPPPPSWWLCSHWWRS